MQLKSIKYSQFDGQPKAWALDELKLGDLNLIVGKNASGKTRALNIINHLAKLLCGEHKPSYDSANFDACFTHDNEMYRYVLHIERKVVTKEEFEWKGKKLTRGPDGAGKIYFEKRREDMEFQTPASELAFTSRRDNLQHPYFEPLYQWASSVYHYAFGGPLGKDKLIVSQKGAAEPDPRNTSLVVEIYKKGAEKFSDEFKKAIKKDFKDVGYDISDIGLAPPSGVVNPIVEGLWVQETGLKDKTEQADISQGMFRALSLVIQLNYSILGHKPSCILIDDIGEGLDFERSCSLIELLLTKVKESKMQLIMTTNDRFVMNKVPLEIWTVLNRQGSDCKVFNTENSKEKFENFRFTGLNNFDFFSTDYLTENKK